MFMGMGMFEIIIIASIALVVVGPEKFPPFAKAVIKTFRDLKTQIEETQREITKEINPVRQELRELSKHKPEDYIDSLTGGALSDTESDFDYEYPYRDSDNTSTKDVDPEPAEDAASPEGTETFGSSAETPVDDSSDAEDEEETKSPASAQMRTDTGDGTD
jgi:Tat protein translocase TatB subunit